MKKAVLWRRSNGIKYSQDLISSLKYCYYFIFIGVLDTYFLKFIYCLGIIFFQRDGTALSASKTLLCLRYAELMGPSGSSFDLILCDLTSIGL